MLGSKTLAVPLAAGAVFILFSATNGYQVGALTGLERYRALVAPAALCSLLTILGAATGALTGGVTGAIVGLSLAAVVRWYLHHRALQREICDLGIAKHSPGSWKELSLLSGFAIPAALSGYLMIPGLWFANAMLVRQPDGYAHMAHYAAAQTLRVMVMFVPLLMNSVGLAILNVRGANIQGADAAVHRMNRVALTGSTAAVALLVAVCGPFILRIFGSDFAASDHSVLWILLASTIFESALLSSLQPIQAAGRMWLALVAIAIPWQAVFVASAYILIPRFAAAGLALAYLIGIATALLATTIAAASIHQPARPANAPPGSNRFQRENTMSILRFLSDLPRLARWVHTQYHVRKDPVAYARSLGVTIGEGSWLYGGDLGMFGSEPYLITIGKNVQIANEVRFITHDGMAIVLRARHPGIST